jgi:hypothetical protein
MSTLQALGRVYSPTLCLLKQTYTSRFMLTSVSKATGTVRSGFLASERPFSVRAFSRRV